MRERLNAVKGTFTIKSSPGYGTVLEASVPLPEEERFT
jgi:signal transduction histidine kinase